MPNKLKITFALLCIAQLLFAQNENIQITGMVLTSEQQPIEYATVAVINEISNDMLAGTTTDLEGRYEVSVNTKNFKIEISFIGFNTITLTNPVIEGNMCDMGVALLVEDKEMLDEVVLRAEKSQTEFKLDKRVFNVGKDLSTTGASALEVLNNVPSVNVNIEGTISLRGSSGVQILIDGKPSVLASDQGNALGSITADMIQQVEVITNPSAKYDAEGTSGIINIVMKKEEKRGLNGSVTLNAGIPMNHSFGLSLNRRTEKFNLFGQLGVGRRELPFDTENINRNIVNNTSVVSEGKAYRNETFYNIILGTDYHLNDNNIITLSGFYAFEDEDQPSDFRISEKENGAVISEWLRNEETEATNPKYRYELQYQRDFEEKEHKLVFSALGNLFSKDQESVFNNTPILGTAPILEQTTATKFKESRYTFKLDYSKPYSKQFKIELGSQYVINDVSNDYEVLNLEDDEWVVDPNFTNLFEYDQKVYATYGTGAYEGNRFGIKGGLRLENTDLSTLLTNTNEANNQTFTDFFPSIHTSYKQSERLSWQLSYSRRIFRPRLWDLNPFFNIRNNFSVRTGNPKLLPEYTDSYEFTGIYILESISFNFGVYHRYTTDIIERLSVFEDNVNTYKPFNIGTNNATGVEFNSKYSPSKKVTFNTDFNFFYFDRKGTYEDQDFNFDGSQWNGKVVGKFKLPYQIDFELTGQYRSSFKTLQGETLDRAFADLGLRKKILKGRGVINISVRDIFNSRINEDIVDQEDFYIYVRRQRGRFVTMGFSYGFGKGDAMEFQGRRW